MEKSETLKWVFISIGGSVAALISFSIIFEMLIPDLCYYHTHEMDSVLNLFYSAGPADNGHPSPTLLNFLFSFLLGGGLAYVVYKYWTDKNEGEKDAK